MRLGAALVLAFLLLASGCSSNHEKAAAPTPHGLIAITGADIPDGEIVRVDPSRLRPRARPRVPVGAHGGPWALSPDRFSVALGGPSSVRLIDIVRMRSIGDVRTGRDTLALSWPTRQRLLVAGSASQGREIELLAVDLARRRVVARHRVAGFVVDVAGERELQVLVAPVGRIGPARLVVLEPDGSMRSLFLRRIASGTRTVPVDSELTVDRYQAPGLATTGDGRAFVVTHDDLVAEIELHSLDVGYHELREQASLLRRVLNWLDPAAQAKGLSDGSTRDALWLGDDRLAVFGWDDHAVRGARGFTQRESPASLRLVDTRSWTVRTIDPDASDALRAGEVLLAFGTTYPMTARSHGHGLRTYTLSGDPLFRFFPRQPVWDVQVAGSRAYVSFEEVSQNATVDLASGEVLERFEGQAPSLLTGG